VKARSGYSETMVIAVVCLALAARIGWQPRGNRLRNWILLGLVAGIGLWNDLLIAVALALWPWPSSAARRRSGGGGPCAGRELHWSPCSWLLPWLAYNATHHLASLQNLPSYVTSIRMRSRGWWSRNCRSSRDLLGVRQEHRDSVGRVDRPGRLAARSCGCAGSDRRLLRGNLTSVEPVEMLLAIARWRWSRWSPAGSTTCPASPLPHPLAVPLALAATLVLMVRSRWRLVAAGLGIAYLVMASFTAVAPPWTPRRPHHRRFHPLNRAQIVTDLEARHVTVLFGDYWWPGHPLPEQGPYRCRRLQRADRFPLGPGGRRGVAGSCMAVRGWRSQHRGLPGADARHRSDGERGLRGRIRALFRAVISAGSADLTAFTS